MGRPYNVRKVVRRQDFTLVPTLTLKGEGAERSRAFTCRRTIANLTQCRRPTRIVPEIAFISHRHFQRNKRHLTGRSALSYETVILEKKDHVARVTLNRPERLNALNRQMFRELNSALDDVGTDSDIWAVVLTGAGRAFCASADIKEERQEGDRLLGYMEPNEIYQFIRSGPQAITLKLHQMDKPTIAMVNGLAIGDGFDFVLACDIRVGCEHSRFMNAFLQMGLVSNTGATWLYPRALGVNKALELLFTGDWLESDEELEAETMALVAKIVGKSPVANRLVKGMVFRGLGQSLEEHLPEAAHAEVLSLASEDHREALAAFLEKRQPEFKGR